jgi:hypothetical protein
MIEPSWTVTYQLPTGSRGRITLQAYRAGLAAQFARRRLRAQGFRVVILGVARA